MGVNGRQFAIQPSGDDSKLKPLDAPATLAAATADVLRKSILAGDFAPGERLPEAVIARRLGISRGPVREALGILRAEGLARDEPRRGFFVTQLTPEDVREIYELRSALEAKAAGLIIQRGDEEALAALEDMLTGLRSAAARGDAEEFARLDFGLHEELARRSGNARLHRVFVQQAGVLSALLRLEVTTQYASLGGILGEHEELVGEILSRDAARAEAACALHLEQALDRVLEMIAGRVQVG